MGRASADVTDSPKKLAELARRRGRRSQLAMSGRSQSDSNSQIPVAGAKPPRQHDKRSWASYSLAMPDQDLDPPAESAGFESLLDQNLSALRAFVRLRTSRKLRQLESHVDLVQSVCREALDARDKLEIRGDNEFRNWLFTLAKRKLVERDRHWNAKKRDVQRVVRAHMTGDGDRDWNLVDQYATFSTPSMSARSKEEIERIEAAFDRLNEDQREVVSLVRVGGMTHAEAAEIMGCSEDNSRQLLRRALVRLALALEESEPRDSG